GVPARDVPPRVEQEDSVVADALHQEAEGVVSLLRGGVDRILVVRGGHRLASPLGWLVRPTLGAPDGLLNLYAVQSADRDREASDTILIISSAPATLLSAGTGFFPQRCIPSGPARP